MEDGLADLRDAKERYRRFKQVRGAWRAGIREAARMAKQL
jgi:hypothetical protein